MTAVVFAVRHLGIKSDSRARALAYPRMVAMYLARKHTGAAYSEIGRYFGGRNHSTVISAEKKVLGWLRDEERCALETLAQGVNGEGEPDEAADDKRLEGVSQQKPGQDDGE